MSCSRVLNEKCPHLFYDDIEHLEFTGFDAFWFDESVLGLNVVFLDEYFPTILRLISTSKGQQILPMIDIHIPKDVNLQQDQYGNLTTCSSTRVLWEYT